MLERFCTMYETCKFQSMGYILALTQASVLIGSKNVRVCDLKLLQKTPIIYLIQAGMVWEGKQIHAVICNLSIDYMSVLQVYIYVCLV